MVNFIDIGLMFVILPILIFYDSWMRLGRLGWEWFVFGFLAMSLFSAVLTDIVFPLWFQEKNLFAILVTRGIILTGVSIFFGIYTAVEQPVLARGRKWRLLRSIVAAFIAVVMLGSILQAIKSDNPIQVDPPLYGWLLIFVAIAFIVTQVGGYACRDQARIEAYQKQKQVEQNESDESVRAEKTTWNCPRCNAENPNVTFECYSCSYRLK